ncbi:phosphohydrolase [Paenibacillus rigui]|uniref:Phosphohydrolase n=1 Tax=Paenibacillus rigui TaxID=554312 RepID=A0A229UHD8_9BACL|nr:phosphohydrolase [Paenibacillus rigui]
MYRVDVAYALITNEENNKVLVVRNIHTSSWSLPGGSVEKEESWAAAAIREAKEETGLEVELAGICAVNECLFEDRGEHVVFVTFQARAVQENILISRPHEIAEVRWVGLDEADRLMPYYRQGIRQLIAATPVFYDFQGKQTLRTYNEN